MTGINHVQVFLKITQIKFMSFIQSAFGTIVHRVTNNKVIIHIYCTNEVRDLAL